MWDKLKAPFEDKDLEWRVQQSGVKNGKPWAMILCYVDARAVMDRLDAVLSPENWCDSYEWREGGVVCKLSVKCGDEWIAKIDGSPETAVEAFKGGISKALVRTAVKWGIGRYLYDMPVTFANFVDRKTPQSRSAKIKDSSGKEIWCNWEAPKINTKKPEQKKTAVRKIDLSGLLQVAKEKGWENQDIKNTMIDMFNKKESKLLTQAEVNGLIDHIKNDIPSHALRG